MTNSEKRLERARKRIKEDDSMKQEDREMIQRFDVLLNHDSAGLRRHTQVLDHVGLVASRRDAHGVALSELFNSEDAVIQVLDWIEGGEYYDRNKNKTYEWGTKAKTHYRSSLRKFGKVLNDGELPEPMELIYGGDNTKLSESAPKPHEVIQWEDAVTLLNACRNSRDKALIATAWDSGARPSELRNLTYGDISPDGDFIKVTIGGKNTPMRDPRLVIASPFLKYWLKKSHPGNRTKGGLSSETSVWTCIDTNDSLSYSAFTKRIKYEIAPRTDIKKPTNLRNFRRSRASVLASREEIGRGDLEERLGWVKGSRIPAVYITRFGSGTDDKIAKSDGLSRESLPQSDHEEFADPAPVQCPNCSRWTPRYEETCLWCSTGFNPSALREAEHQVEDTPVKTKARRDLIELVTNGEINEEDIESARELANVIKGYPELLDYAEDIQELLSRFDVENGEGRGEPKRKEDDTEDE